MIILGINAYHANASAAIVVDGQLLAAVEEERLNRVKYAAGLPARAIQYCLDQAGAKLAEVDHIAIPRDPWARLGTKLRFAMRMPRFALERARVMARFAGIREDWQRRLKWLPKAFARSSIASSITPRISPAHISFRRSNAPRCFPPTAWAILPAPCGRMAKGRACRCSGEVTFPHSLGMYYTALTQYLGFWKFGDEYKVMGLAAYGQPEFLEEFRRIVRADAPLVVPTRPGIFHASESRAGNDLARCGQHAGARPTIFAVSREAAGAGASSGRTARAAAPRSRGEHAGGARRSAGRALERAGRKDGQKSLCLAGGVAFNCVANGKIFDRTPFERVYVQPAAGDAGLSVGAAFAVEHQVLGRPRAFVMEPRRTGARNFRRSEIRRAIDERGRFERRVANRRNWMRKRFVRTTARHIAAGKIVGWFQGASRMGPARAWQSQHSGRSAARGDEGCL